MKNIIATTIALTIATTASANATWNNDNDVTWNGPSNSYHSDGCQYRAQTDGVMKLDSGSLVWETTSPASITVESHGQGNIKVERTNVLTGGGSTFETGITVNYKGLVGSPSNVISAKARTVNVNDNAITYQTAQNGKTKAVINIQGTVTMTQAVADQILNGKTYTVTHTVTCLQ